VLIMGMIAGGRKPATRTAIAAASKAYSIYILALLILSQCPDAKRRADIM